jgi:hypothetical protein
MYPRQSTWSSALAPMKAWFHSAPKFVSVRSQKKTPPHKQDRSFQEFGLPPRPRKFRRKEFALSLLRAGAEIEHSLAIQYLYAAYSIDETSEKRKNIESLTWKTVLRLVAREEMAHLVTVQNLLLALGAEPHLNRGPLHRTESKLPLPFQLEQLNKESVGKFVLFESPAPAQMSVKDGKVVRQIQKDLGKRSHVLRVGSIYAALYWLFMENDKPGPDWPFSEADAEDLRKKYPRKYHLKDKDFVRANDYEERAASAKEWGIFESSTHVDGASPRDAALASLRWIMTQGEGPNAIEDSHFCRFLKVYKEFQKSSRFLIMNVPLNPRVQGAKGGGTPGVETGKSITNAQTKLWGALFNSRYQFMLLDILDALRTSRKTQAEKRRLFAIWASVEMEFIKKIGQVLPRMFLTNPKKRKAGSYGKVPAPPPAGAPFQTAFLPSTPADRQALRHRLLEASAGCVSALRDAPRPTSSYTEDPATAATAASLLDAIARQDDEMRHALEG